MLQQYSSAPYVTAVYYCRCDFFFVFLNRADEAGRPEEFIVRGLALVLEWI
jgi:hypothetical protein